MTHYFRKAIQLATETQGSIFWADNTQSDKSILAIGYVYLNGTLLTVKVTNDYVIVLHQRSSGSQRLATVQRSDDKSEDIRYALYSAVLDN